MEKFMANIKKHWRTYVMALWMIGISGYLFYLNGQIRAMAETSAKISSDVDSIESILISTDSNVMSIKKGLETVDANVAAIYQKVKRR